MAKKPDKPDTYVVLKGVASRCNAVIEDIEHDLANDVALIAVWWLGLPADAAPHVFRLPAPYDPTAFEVMLMMRRAR